MSSKVQFGVGLANEYPDLAPTSEFNLSGPPRSVLHNPSPRNKLHMKPQPKRIKNSVSYTIHNLACHEINSLSHANRHRVKSKPLAA